MERVPHGDAHLGHRHRGGGGAGERGRVLVGVDLRSQGARWSAVRDEMVRGWVGRGGSKGGESGRRAGRRAEKTYRHAGGARRAERGWVGGWGGADLHVRVGAEERLEVLGGGGRGARDAAAALRVPERDLGLGGGGARRGGRRPEREHLQQLVVLEAEVGRRLRGVHRLLNNLGQHVVLSVRGAEGERRSRG